MARADIHRYRSVASSRAIGILLTRLTAEEKSELQAKLAAEHKTLQEYVGGLLTAHEIWDLVEWDSVPETEADEPGISPLTRPPVGGPAHPRS